MFLKTKKRKTKKNKIKIKKTQKRKSKRNITLKNKTKLKNTRNQLCSSKNWTVCCPHQKPDSQGRYAATNEVTTLFYNNRKYKLHTCCKMCSKSMNDLSKNKPALFKILYKPVVKKGYLKLSNKWTKRCVQHLKLINKTYTGGNDNNTILVITDLEPDDMIAIMTLIYTVEPSKTIHLHISGAKKGGREEWYLAKETDLKNILKNIQYETSEDGETWVHTVDEGISYPNITISCSLIKPLANKFGETSTIDSCLIIGPMRDLFNVQFKVQNNIYIYMGFNFTESFKDIDRYDCKEQFNKWVPSIEELSEIDTKIKSNWTTYDAEFKDEVFEKLKKCLPDELFGNDNTLQQYRDKIIQINSTWFRDNSDQLNPQSLRDDLDYCRTFKWVKNTPLYDYINKDDSSFVENTIPTFILKGPDGPNIPIREIERYDKMMRDVGTWLLENTLEYEQLDPNIKNKIARLNQDTGKSPFAPKWQTLLWNKLFAPLKEDSTFITIIIKLIELESNKKSYQESENWPPKELHSILIENENIKNIFSKYKNIDKSPDPMWGDTMAVLAYRNNQIKSFYDKNIVTKLQELFKDTMLQLKLITPVYKEGSHYE